MDPTVAPVGVYAGQSTLEGAFLSGIRWATLPEKGCLKGCKEIEEAFQYFFKNFPKSGAVVVYR